MPYTTKEEVVSITGISPNKIGLSDQTALDANLDMWIEWVSGEITTRLREEVLSTDSRFPGLSGLCARYVAKIVQKTVQNKTSHTLRQGETMLNYPDMSEIIQGIAEELNPYRKRNINVFLSYVPDEETTP